MTIQTIRSTLGQLQDAPDREQAWKELETALGAEGGESHTAELLTSARNEHAVRRQYEAVARLLGLEIRLATGTERETALLEELGRVLDEELLDDAAAVTTFKQLLELDPNHAQALEAVEKSEAKRARWRELAQRYIDEADRTKENSFRSSLLTSAAETVYRFGRAQLDETGADGKSLRDDVVARLRQAIDLDPKNRRAALLLERLFRTRGDWEEVARVLERFAADTTAKDEKLAALIRLARVLQDRLGAPERAASVYERIIDLAPGNIEAAAALVDYFTAREMWDHLVALYEEQLAGGAVGTGQETGVLLQIAMLRWKMQARPDAAEPYFEKLRRYEPAHPGMLDFFREFCSSTGEVSRLIGVLTDAQRSLGEGRERAKLSTEIATLAEQGGVSAKAVEQWRALLRQDPTNAEARDALKRLYRQTGAFSQLIELLQKELELASPTDLALRARLLREIAAIYREKLPSELSLVTVLTQLLVVDPNDLGAMRELARVYENLGRVRDLLSLQMRLADAEQDPGAKADLYRAVARRWLSQFSNVQNAIEAYEKLRTAAPHDGEALSQLKELYGKRRAHKELYALLEAQAETMAPGAERRAVWLDMAKLLAERLERAPEAIALWHKVLEEDPADAQALASLERQAERDRDHAALANVLERRVKLASQAEAINLLYTLSGLYEARLGDVKQAMSAWRRVLELDPSQVKAHRSLRDALLAERDYDGLTAFYAPTGDWEGLTEVLLSAADRSHDAATKVDLSFRAADIFRERLEQPDRAARAYERILAAKPDDKRATELLVPIYEREQRWGKLPALYETLLVYAESDDERLEILDRLSLIASKHLQDRALVFGYARRAFELAPLREGALDALESAAKEAGELEAFVLTLNTRLKDDPGPVERRRLRTKLAELYAGPLQRVDDAIVSYRSLLEEDESDPQPLSALEQILRRKLDAERRHTHASISPALADDMRWVYATRIERTQEIHDKADLLREVAELERAEFGQATRAIEAYRRALELEPGDQDTARAVVALLRETGQPEAAAQVLERLCDTVKKSERVEYQLELAELYAGSLERPSDALAALKQVLETVPGEARALAGLEGLLPVAAVRAQVAILLDDFYGRAGQLRKQADALRIRIATAPSKQDTLSLFGRLATVHERQGDYAAAFEVTLKAADEFPRELALWDRLSTLANRAGKTLDFVEALARAVPKDGESGLPLDIELDLAERVATLCEEKLGDVDRALPYLERILAKEPNNPRAFSRLKQILTVRERWADLEAAYERVIEAASDPRRKAELYSEVALVAEEITGDSARAITYYERLLAVLPEHVAATRALDKLYEREKRWADLASLLSRWLEHATEAERKGLRLRLGGVLLRELGRAGEAIDVLSAVLDAEMANVPARQLMEQCLDLPEQRQRAAEILERVYRHLGHARELARVLEVRLEQNLADDTRRELLLHLVETYDDRLHDDASALRGYTRLLPLMAQETEIRDKMLVIARRLSAFDVAVSALRDAASKAEPSAQAELLLEMGKILDRDLAQPEGAIGAFEQIVALAPEDANVGLAASRALAKLYADAKRYPDLVRTLRTEAKYQTDPSERRAVHARIGELCEKNLGDPQGAIAAWRARLADDPADAPALESLDRLLTATQDWKSLVEVLRAREGHATDAPLRRQLMERIATTLADHMSETADAILAYRALLDEFGAERAWMQSLEKLYEKDERWADLAETLDAELSIVEDDRERAPILSKVGLVRADKLGDLEGAIEAHRWALSIDARHAPSRDALERMLVDPNGRHDAALILRPIYEREEDHVRLLRVLDIEISHADAPSDRLVLLGQASEVAEGPLGDAGRAFAYAVRAIREAGPGDLLDWVARTDALAASTHRWSEFIDVLREVLPNITDPELELSVLHKLAELARDRVNDLSLARDFYRKVLEEAPAERRALLALEAIYEKTESRKDLFDLLSVRAEAAESPDERKDVLLKMADLAERGLGDDAAAIRAHEEVVDLEFDARSLEALERLYPKTGRFTDLAALHERELEYGGIEAERKALLHHKLAELARHHLGEMDRAFDEYEAALEINPQYPATVAALEAWMQDAERGPQAARMLEAVYAVQLDWRKLMTALEVRLAASDDPDERKQLLARVAKLHEEQEENYPAALDTLAKLLAEDIADESTWGELDRIARVANAEARLAEIYSQALEKVTADDAQTAALCRRVAKVFESQNEWERALVYYRRALAFAPDKSPDAFAAIDQILTRQARPVERIALYRASLDVREEPNERLLAFQTIAQIQEKDLGDDEGAIESHRAAIEVDDTDVTSLDALGRLYERRERWSDVVQLYRLRADHSALPEDEARFRIRLAELLETKENDPSSAIDEYRATYALGATSVRMKALSALEALLAQPAHKAKVVEILEPIYQDEGDWSKQIRLNDERLGLADDAGEKVGLLRRTARLWEERGKNEKNAFEALQRAFALDPEDSQLQLELDRLAGATGQWDALAESYEGAVQATTGSVQRDLLEAVGKLHDERRDDPRRALSAYQRLSALDETELVPIDKVITFATLVSDWRALVSALEKKAENTLADEDRAAAWRRAGFVLRDMVEDAPAALVAFEKSLALEPTNIPSLDALIDLYEGKDDASRLVVLYRERADLADDSDLKFRLISQAAQRYETGLADPKQAIALFNEALLLRAGDETTLLSLARLFESEQMWPDLLENLRAQTLTAQGDARVLLFKRIGQLLSEHLDSKAEALDAYAEVLRAGYDESSAHAALSIGQAREELRLQAAALLESVLRPAGRAAELVRALEMRLTVETSADDRQRTLRDIAKTTETELGNPADALSSLLLALQEVPEDADLHADIERLCDKVGTDAWQRYADALGERGRSLFDAETSSDMHQRLGKVSEEKLGDDARAARAYSEAAERGGDTVAILTALDRLWTRMGDTRVVSQILERRLGLETEPKAQADLQVRLATLLYRDLGEKSQGLSMLRQALDHEPAHTGAVEQLRLALEDADLFEEAFEALEQAFRSTENGTALAELYEKRVTRAKDAGERNRARLDWARVLEEDAGNPARAQEVLEAALAEDVGQSEVLEEVERLAGKRDGWQSAATVLDVALRRADLPAGVRVELWTKLALWYRDRLSDKAQAEGALREARELDPENAETLHAIEELQRASGRERDLVATLRALAKLERSGSAKRAFLVEAKDLAEKALSDAALTEEIVREVLAEDDADFWALEELTKLREAAHDTRSVVELLLKRASVASTEDEADTLTLRAAAVTEGTGDAAGAIRLLEDLLAKRDVSSRAIAELQRLYTAEHRDRDLAALERKIATESKETSERSAAYLRLTSLYEEKLASIPDAIDALRDLLRNNADHVEGSERLARLLAKSERYEELADFIRQRAERPELAKDQAVTAWLELGAICDQKLSQPTRALEAYERALALDPDHRAAWPEVARLAEATGEWARAATALDKLSRGTSGDEAIQFALRLAAARRAQDDFAGVEEALSFALSLDAKHPDVRAQLRALYESRERWTDLAALIAGDAELLASAHPDDVKPPSGPVTSIPPTGVARAEVAQLLRKAAEIHLDKRNDAEGALPILERASEILPEDRELSSMLVDVYVRAHRTRDAARVLERVILSFGTKRGKDAAPFYHRLAQLLTDLGEKEQALSQLDLAFKMDPGSTPILRDLSLLSLEVGDLERAQKTFRALLLQRLDTQSKITKAEVFFYLAQISQKQGDPAKATQMAEKALENDPSLERAKELLSSLKGA